MKQLGLGPPPVPRQKLGAAKLAKVFRALVEDEATARAAAAMGQRLREENGASNVLDLVERKSAA